MSVVCRRWERRDLTSAALSWYARAEALSRNEIMIIRHYGIWRHGLVMDDNHYGHHRHKPKITFFVNIFWGFISVIPRQKCILYEKNAICFTFGSVSTDKKENQIFLKYKEIKKGSVAKPYMANGLLIYGLIFEYFLIH